MKKFLDKSLIFLGAGVIALLVELLILNSSLQQLNVLTYLLTVGIIPAVMLFVSLLLYSITAKAPAKLTYVMAIVLALVFSGIMLAYCSAVVTPELMDTILANSITSENTQVSMTAASTGDNIQSILMYTAFAGLGALVGNRIRRKKAPTPVVTAQDEYDN